MLKILNKVFDILPISISEIRENFLLRYLLKFILKRKQLLLGVILLYASSIFLMEYFDIKFKIIESVDIKYLRHFYMFLYLLLDGIVNPAHWIEMGILYYFIKTINKIYKMIQPTLVTKREFVIAAIYPILLVALTLDVIHLTIYGLANFLAKNQGQNPKFLYALYTSPVFYLSSFLLSVVSILITYRIYLKLKSLILSIIASAIVIYLIYPGLVFLLFSVFINRMITTTYSDKGFGFYILLEFSPYVIFSLIIIFILGRYLNRNMYDKFGELLNK